MQPIDNALSRVALAGLIVASQTGHVPPMEWWLWMILVLILVPVHLHFSFERKRKW